MRALAVLLVVVLLGGGVALLVLPKMRPPLEPPAIAREDSDPRVFQAIESARAAVLAEPNSGAAWGRLGAVLYAHEFSELARPCFWEAEFYDDANPSWPYFLGSIDAAEKPEDAIFPFRRSAEKSEQGANALAARLRLGEILFELDRVDEAEKEFTLVLERDRDNARALLGLARIAVRRGDLDASLERLAKIENHPRARKAAKLLLAQIYSRKRNLDEAERHRREAIALPETTWPDPHLDELKKLRRGKKALLVEADVLLGRGKFAEARELLKEVVRDYPDSPWAWILLGRAHLKLRKLDDAEKALREALRLEPTSVEAEFRIGVVYTFRQDFAEAAKWFQSATEKKPDFARAQFNLGYCLGKLGKLEDAIAPLRAAVRSEPENPQAHSLLGHTLGLAGHLDDALIPLGDALKLNPADPFARRRIAEISRQLGLPVPEEAVGP